jgi:Spy/CpxP family protein refolding chaperone
MEHLYPVHLVRHHAEELKLSDSQLQKLREVVLRVKGEIERLKWDLEREAQKLMQLVAKGAKREEIYAQMDRVFAHENQIKKKRLGLMISVRDILNSKQRKQLDKIKGELRKSEGSWWKGRGKGKGKQGKRFGKHLRSRG